MNEEIDVSADQSSDLMLETSRRERKMHSENSRESAKRSSRHRRRIASLSLAAAAAAGLLQTRMAAATAIYTWNGSATGTWNTTGTNWNPSSSTAWDSSADGANSQAVFNTASLVAPVSGTVYANGITFSTAGSLTGGTINLAGTSPFITANANATISSTLAGSAGLLLNGSATLTLNGPVTTYTGATVVSGGTLLLAGSTDIASTSSVTINNNGTISIGASNDYLGTSSTVLTTINSGGTLTINSAVTAHLGNLVLAGGTLATNGGTPSSTGASFGPWNLDHGVTAGGTTATSTISALDVSLTESGGTIFNVASGATSGIDLDVTGYFGGAYGNTGLIKTGNGVMRLDAANTYAAATTISGGTLELNFAAAGAPASNILPSGYGLTLAGGTLNVNGASTNTSQTVASLTLNSGSSTISMTNNGAGSNALAFTSGTITHNTGGSVDFVAPSGTSIKVGSTSNAFLGTYAFFGSGSSETYAATNSSGVVQAATLTSATGVNAFTSATANYAYTSPGTPDNQTISAATANTVVFNNSAAQVIDINSSGGTNTLTLNGFMNVGAGALTIQQSNGTGNLVIGSNNELVIGGPSNVTISAPIANNGTFAGALTDSNTGTVALTGVNVFTGATAVVGGTLQVGGAGSLNSGNYSGTLTVAPGATFNYASTAPQTLNSIAGAGTVSLTGSGTAGGSGGGTVTVNGNQSFTGTLNVSGENLTLTNGTQAGYSGNNSGMFGPVAAINITNSTLTLTPSSNSFLGTSAATSSTVVTINGGGIITQNGSATFHLPTTLILAGGTLASGAASSSGATYGTYNLDEGVTTSGSTTTSTISAPDVSLTETGGTVFNVVAGGTSSGIDLNVTGTFGSAYGNTGLIKTGNGTMALSGSGNSYGGGTVISAGTLYLQSTPTTGTISGAGTLELGNGVDFNNSNGATTVAMGAGGLIYVPSGATVTGSGGYEGVWSTNHASLTVNGTIDFYEAGSGTAGATLQFDALNGSGTIAAGYITVRNLQIGAANGSGTFSGVLADSGSSGGTMELTKIGTGSQILSASSTYSGGTTISAGTLRANNGVSNGSATGSGNITVAASSPAGNYAGAVLGGSGVVTGTVTLGSGAVEQVGIIAAGSSSNTTSGLGTLKTGAETWQNGSVYQWKIGSSAGTSGATFTSINGTPGTTYDNLLIGTGTTGQLTVPSSGAVVTIEPLGSLTGVTGGTTYDWAIAQVGSGNSIIANGGAGISASSSPVPSASFALDTSGLNASINGGASTTAAGTFSLLFESVGSNNDLVLQYNAAPEPGTAMLMAAAGPLLLARRRRRQQCN